MFEIAKWYNNFQAPSVLMIDDLSDAYIDVYKESYKNDWGYLCDSKDSSYYFLNEQLLKKFPKIKITFFTPYLRHNVINENSNYKIKKYSIGERIEFTQFLKKLTSIGHEIAHHGSNHGKYIDVKKPTTVNNWIHEWALFDQEKTGIEITSKGVDIFKNVCDIDIVGGKYCGYISTDNSETIIDKCKFLYWCDKPSYNIGQFDEGFFGLNNIISFPTNYAGNSFVRLSYKTNDIQRDKKKKILKYFQPIYSLYSYFKLYKLYRNRSILSIQEHYSPSTTAGTVQSANIITDIESLKKIFSFLDKLSIWYATCREIASYISVRENCKLEVSGQKLIISSTKKDLVRNIISITYIRAFCLEKEGKVLYSKQNNGKHVINLRINELPSIYNITYI